MSSPAHDSAERYRIEKEKEKELKEAEGEEYW